MFDQFIDQPTMESVRAKLKHVLSMRGDTATALGNRLPGNSPNKITRFLAGGGIGLETFLYIEGDLDLPPGFLLGAVGAASKEDIDALLEAVDRKGAPDQERGTTIDDFIGWYQACGGVFDANSSIAEDIDVYGAPSERGPMVNPLRIGKNSLLRQRFGSHDPQMAMSLISEQNKCFCEESASAHKRVIDGASILDQRQINEVFRGKVTIVGTFTRILQPGTWRGVPVVLSFVREV